MTQFQKINKKYPAAYTEFKIKKILRNEKHQNCPKNSFFWSYKLLKQLPDVWKMWLKEAYLGFNRSYSDLKKWKKKLFRFSKQILFYSIYFDVFHVKREICGLWIIFVARKQMTKLFEAFFDFTHVYISFGVSSK